MKYGRFSELEVGFSRPLSAWRPDFRTLRAASSIFSRPVACVDIKIIFASGFEAKFLNSANLYVRQQHALLDDVGHAAPVLRGIDPAGGTGRVLGDGASSTGLRK